MKKIVFSLIAVVALLSMGCEQPAAPSSLGTSGNPKAIEGTWAGTVTNLDASLNIAGVKEGTWTRTTVVTPSPTRTVETVTGGVTVTAKHVYDDPTETTKNDVVISANGSYTHTKTVTKVYVARAAETVPTNTATNSYTTTRYLGNVVQQVATTGVSVAENLAGTETVVTTLTVTVESMYEGTYKQTSVTNTVTTRSGARYPAGSAETSKTEPTATTVTPNLLVGGLSFNGSFDGIALSDANYTQTVKPNNRDELSKKVDWSIVIKEDGSYTWTKTTTETRAAKAATATVPAVTVGTRTTTIVEDGWATVTISQAYNFGREEKILMLSAVKAATTKIATGGLITSDFPAVAKTIETGNIQLNNAFRYTITSGSKFDRLVLMDTNTSGTPPAINVVLQKTK